MDTFEKYIRENNPAFDTHVADKTKIWAAISEELDNEKPKLIPIWKKTFFRVAASIVIILGIISIIDFNSPKPETTFSSMELEQIDMHYQSMVEKQVELVKNSPNLSSANKKEFLAFLNELDKEYDDLKLELTKNIDNELVLEAIINNYKKRIELIENLLQQIKDSKNPTSENEYVL